MKTQQTSSPRKLARALVLGAVSLSAGTLLFASSASAAQNTFTVTKNTYDGDDWWGTVTFKNNGPLPAESFAVTFEIPSGKHCTNDYVPPGATLSPLQGSGSSARTVSNKCTYTWIATTPLQPGQSKTFNYSTDTQSFSSASKLHVDDAGTAGTCSTLAVTKNEYDGGDWWGTITIKNGGPYSSYNYKVEFDVPAGKHCTNDYVPPGATLSPLNGSGSSARTVSNHCVYSWTNASPIAANGSKTFNYSTDSNSSSFKSASNIKASDSATCVGEQCLPLQSFCDAGSNCCPGSVCGVSGRCEPGVCLADGALCDPLNVNQFCCSNACLCPVDVACFCGNTVP